MEAQVFVHMKLKKQLLGGSVHYYSPLKYVLMRQRLKVSEEGGKD